ncbi:MAG: hypothetical protein ACLR4V_07495 [Bifidobacterium bifidum]
MNPDIHRMPPHGRTSRSSTCPPWRSRSSAEGAPEPIRIIDEPEPGEATAGDAVIEYTRDHLPVNMGVDTNHSDFTREQAEQLVGDIQEQLYETAKSQKRLHDLIAQAYDGRAWIALGYPAGQIGWNRMCQDKFTADAVRLTVQQRTNLILSFQDDPISNVALAAALGVSDMTVGRVAEKEREIPEGRRREAEAGRGHGRQTPQRAGAHAGGTPRTRREDP